MRSRCVVLLVLLAGCEIEKIAIPSTEPRVSLHGVLSATAPTQVVLLERTRSGLVQLIAPPFDVVDPVVSDEGIAESGAVVTLTTPTGQTLVAREDNTVRDDGKGAGIYRFALAGSSLQRGGTYHLSVRTSGGVDLVAETSVPGGVPADVAEPRVFDRVRDTMFLEWSATPGARSYLVRIETPYGPRSFFTDGTRARLDGALRNVELDELPHVFIPGFQQAVTVSAVDSNFYDWYRTHNDALTGSGLINRVRGGFGVFGALVRLHFEDLHVVAPQEEAEAGLFRFVGTPAERASTPFLSLELYVESRASRAGQGDALSGRYEKRLIIGETDPLRGLLGTARDGRIELAFLRRWYASDTSEIFTGEIRGDTIVGTYRGQGGLARFVRQP